MANDITVTKNTTSGSERWDVEYTADASGTVTTTMDTAETILDRDIKVTVTIPSGSATTPATTITSNPTISVNSSTGVITASNSKTQSVTPTVSAGYVTGGTSGTITVSGSNTSNLTTQAAQTIYPSTSDQTIASGKYLTGTQTIKAVTTTNLSAGNIKSGVTVKVGDSADDDRVASVTGSYSGIDVSDTTATASDVLSGKYFYTSAGTKTQGSIATKTSSNMTVSGATVTAPAGYYASNASKSVASGTATAPSSISGTSASVSTGTNTLTLSKTVSVTPNVSTAGYISSGTAGNSSVSLTASVTTKGAATYTPTTSNQTIASGTYLTGTQTISGDANLVAGNIKKDTTIFGVTGTYEGGGGGGSINPPAKPKSFSAWYVTTNGDPLIIDFKSMPQYVWVAYGQSDQTDESVGASTRPITGVLILGAASTATAVAAYAYKRKIGSSWYYSLARGSGTTNPPTYTLVANGTGARLTIYPGSTYLFDEYQAYGVMSDAEVNI